MDSQQLLDRFVQRDRRALARILTLVERGQAPELEKLSEKNSSERPPIVVGIAGSGGAGKSTLIGKLLGHLRGRDLSVAVLACDPGSPVSGGALLGDRIRVEFDPADDGIYFRSFSTRGATGGISAAVGPAIRWIAAFGFDVILIETVGIGQDQTAIHPLVDRLVLIVTPATGDEIQWDKAGVIELADVIAVNKADLPGADRVAADLTSSLSLVPGSQPPPIVLVTAASGAGIAELWQAISG